MKKNILIPVFIFLTVVGALIYDIVVTHSEISRNSGVINDIEKDLDKIKFDILATKLKIERLKKDPKVTEDILRKKFDLLRQDQYYIND